MPVGPERIGAGGAERQLRAAGGVEVPRTTIETEAAMATMYNPPHLGELIRESVEAEGWSVTETARRLDIGRVALSRVLNGHAGVSAALALALERIGWSDAEHWMRMQAIYDLAPGQSTEYFW